ncbi:hypothetical protein [Streptomyces sp. NPDC054783]
MLVQRVALPAVRVDSWTVLGDDDVPVEPMKREALVPIDEQLEQQLRDHQRRILEERPEGVSVLFPRADAKSR